jgi:hypothetical protein
MSTAARQLVEPGALQPAKLMKRPAEMLLTGRRLALDSLRTVRDSRRLEAGEVMSIDKFLVNGKGTTPRILS